MKRRKPKEQNNKKQNKKQKLEENEDTSLTKQSQPKSPGRRGRKKKTETNETTKTKKEEQPSSPKKRGRKKKNETSEEKKESVPPSPPRRSRRLSNLTPDFEEELFNSELDEKKVQKKTENIAKQNSSLQRSSTLIITEYETKENSSEEISSLIRSSSSVSRLLQSIDNKEDKKPFFSALSAKSQSLLQKKLIQILTPMDEEIITFIPFSRVDDEGEYEKIVNSCAVEEECDETKTYIADLPPELIVIIFNTLSDVDKWNFATTCKRYLAVFKIYAGFNQIPLLRVTVYSTPRYGGYEEKGVVSNEIHYVQPFELRKYLEGSVHSLFQSNYKSCIEDEFLFVVDTTDPKEIVIVDNQHTKYFNECNFLHNRKSSIDLEKKRFLGCIPISDHSKNGGALEEFHNILFLSLFMGKGTTIDTQKKGTIKGRDAKSHFVNVTATLTVSNYQRCEIRLQFTFNVKEFGRKFDGNENYKFCKVQKFLLLQLLQRECLRKCRFIKWSNPYKATMTLEPTEQPPQMKIQLYDYQLRGLAWMKDFEKKAFKRRFRFCAIHPAPGYPSCDFYMNSGPFDFEDPANFELIRESDDISFETRPDLYDSFSVRGGIMADEMGLGKTLTMVSLIISNPRQKGADKKYHPVHFDHRNLAKFEISATLVICPSQLIPQWENEITTRLSTKLKVISIALINQLRKLTYRDIINSDVVIISHQFLFTNTNYTKLCGDLQSLQERQGDLQINLDDECPILQNFGWHRIILDEGHEVLSDSKLEKPVGKLLFGSFQSTYRWYVSGTPVPRGRDSLVGALNFLDLQLKSGYQLDEDIDRDNIVYEMSVFIAAKRALFWRNRKEEVKTQAIIPNSTEKIIFVHLTQIEQALYDVAVLDKDTRSMRMICSQPSSAPIVAKAWNSTSKFSLEEVMEKMIENYRSKLMTGFALLKTEYTHIEEMTEGIKEETEEQEKLMKEKPENEQTENYQEWKRKQELLEENIENNKRYIRDSEERIKSEEQNLVTKLTQLACIAQGLEREVIKLMELAQCSYCKKKILATKDSPPHFLIVCSHLFCNDCHNSLYVKKEHRGIISCRVYNCSKTIYNIEEEFVPLHFDSKDSVLSEFFDKLYATYGKNLKKYAKIESNSDSNNNNDNIVVENNIKLDDKNKSNDVNNKNVTEKEEEEEEFVEEELLELPPLKKLSKKEKQEMIQKHINKLKKEIVDKYGSKLASMVNWTYEFLKKNRKGKLIVFSKSDQFLKEFHFLLQKYYNQPLSGDIDEMELDEPVLEKKNKSICVMCKGSFVVRKKTVELFNSTQKNSPRVLLLSLSNAASGTHLTVASHVLLADSVLGTKEEVKAADAQAIARVHRIGQDKNVVVLRFLVENSIENQDYLKVYGDN